MNGHRLLPIRSKLIHPKHLPDREQTFPERSARGRIETDNLRLAVLGDNGQDRFRWNCLPIQQVCAVAGDDNASSR